MPPPLHSQSTLIRWSRVAFALAGSAPAEMSGWPAGPCCGFADDDDGSELPRRFAPRDAVRLAQGTPAGLTAPLRPPWRGPLAAPFGVVESRAAHQLVQTSVLDEACHGEAHRAKPGFVLRCAANYALARTAADQPNAQPGFELRPGKPFFGETLSILVAPVFILRGDEVPS